MTRSFGNYDGQDGGSNEGFGPGADGGRSDDVSSAIPASAA